VIFAGAPGPVQVGDAARRRSTRARVAPVALALVNGGVGVVVAPERGLSRVVTFTIRRGRIVEMEVLAAPARLPRLPLAVLED